MMEDHGGSAGILRDGKATTFEGGHRVPTIAYWPRGIAPREYSGVASMLDWFPTFAELAGAAVPQDREIDGRSIVPLLSGQELEGHDTFVYYNKYNARVDGIRQGQWKLKLAQTSMLPVFLEYFLHVGELSHDLLLFDLNNDPGETTNLAAQYPEKVKALQKTIERFSAIKPEYRVRRMKQASADRKGYGYLFTKLSLLGATALLLVGGIIYLFYRIARSGLRKLWK